MTFATSSQHASPFLLRLGRVSRERRTGDQVLSDRSSLDEWTSHASSSTCHETGVADLSEVESHSERWTCRPCAVRDEAHGGPNRVRTWVLLHDEAERARTPPGDIRISSRPSEAGRVRFAAFGYPRRFRRSWLWPGRLPGCFPADWGAARHHVVASWHWPGLRPGLRS